MKQTPNLTEGKIFLPLIRFALPVLLALFLQTMYGAVDLLMVGQFGGSCAEQYVSAVSTGSQIMQTVTVMITGLAMGLTVYAGREIGAGQKERAGKIVGSGIWLFGCIGLIVTAVMIPAAPFLAKIMQAPAEALKETVTYIMICSVGSVFIVGYNLVGSIFRGIGDSQMPLITVAIACVLNIVGDVLFVAVFHLGSAGAAMATVIAQAASLWLSLGMIKRRPIPFSLSMKDIRPKGRYIKHILKLGTPIAFQDLLVNISFLVIIAIVNTLGLTASAGVGVGERLCGFLMLVPSAFMQSMSAFVAQNIGAGKPRRATAALRCAIGSSLLAGVLMAYFTFFHGDLLAGIFAREPQVIAAAADYLQAYAIDCLLTSFLFCFIGYFNGCAQTTFVLIQGVVGAFGVRIPLSWIMSRQAGVTLFHIGLATPASSFIQILLCVGCYFLTREKKAEKSKA